MKFKYTIEPGSTRSQWKVLENGDMIAICQNEPNALTMIGILNEHDTLKAKVELLDEALEWADLCRQLLFQCGDSAFPKTKRGIEKINTLLSKAKDLSK